MWIGWIGTVGIPTVRYPTETVVPYKVHREYNFIFTLVSYMGHGAGLAGYSNRF